MKSMTGYGTSTYIDDNIELQIEIKSVNNKLFDLKIVNCKELIFLENEIRDIVFSRIKRGRVDIRIIFRDKQLPEIELDEPRLLTYNDMLQKIKALINIETTISVDTILRDPEIFVYKKADYDTETFREIVFNCLEEAIEKHQIMAHRDGMSMLAFFQESIDTISTCLKQITNTIPYHREKLKENLINTVKQILETEITPELEKRILVETALYLDRCDITEEIVRTESHIDNIKEYLRPASDEIGRSMNFILQEMHREINTISSKYTTTNTYLDVLKMKEELEKCKEQVQNVE